MVFFKNYISNLDFTRLVLEYGISKFPEKIPKYNGNIISYGRQLNDTIRELIPLYMKDNNYNMVIPFK